MIKAFGADSPDLPEADQYGTDLILLDAPSPGSGKLFDWRLASDVPDGMRLILAGGLDPDNVADAIEIVEPWGVDVAIGGRGITWQEGSRPRSDDSSPTPAPLRPPPTSALTSCPTTGPTNEDTMNRHHRHR